MLSENISFTDVHFSDGFWKEKTDRNRLVSLEAVYRRFEETGRFDALRFKYREGKGAYPHIYYDSDVAKWIEAVGYLILDGCDCSAYERVIDELVECMRKNQRADGYLNSHYLQVEPENIFTDRNCHELYCAGHLLEAAIVYRRATGKDAFYKIMLAYVALIKRAFITERWAKFTTCGHEEIEIALLRLYEDSGEREYLDMALFFLNARGVAKEPTLIPEVTHKCDQSEMPVRDLTEAEGHAVRATYLYTAMADAAAQTGDEGLLAAARRLFDNITRKRMYITGGIGSARRGETFTVPYDLPNLESYSETCAAIGLLLFCLALRKSGKDARLGDTVERILYNNLLSGVSEDGKSFFYENPLEIHLDSLTKETSQTVQNVYPSPRRFEVFNCSCCPPNLNRTFARLGDVFFAECEDELITDQYAALTMDNGKITLRETTDFPACGKIKLEIVNNTYKTLSFRIPAWCEDAHIDGAAAQRKDGYFVIEDAPETLTLTLDFPMVPAFVECNGNARDNGGKCALTYGPTVYCMEGVDNPFPLSSFRADTSRLPEMRPAGRILPDFTVRGERTGVFSPLYAKVGKFSPVPTDAVFRPYHTFANREKCDMTVWFGRK